MTEEQYNQLLESFEYLEARKTKGVLEHVAIIKEIIEPSLERIKKRIDNQKIGLNGRYLDKDPLNRMSKTYGFLTDVKSDLLGATEDLKYFEREVQDIFHAFELLALGEDEINEYGHKLIENRKKRRSAKETIEILTPLHNLLETDFGREFLKHLPKVREEMKKSIEVRKELTYKPREMTSLQEAFKKAKGV